MPCNTAAALACAALSLVRHVRPSMPRVRTRAGALRADVTRGSAAQGASDAPAADEPPRVAEKARTPRPGHERPALNARGHMMASLALPLVTKHAADKEADNSAGRRTAKGFTNKKKSATERA